MAKSKKTAPSKKAKSEETPEVDTPDNDTAELNQEQEGDKTTQENGEVDVTLKKKGKRKVGKKEEAGSEDGVTDESPPQENGDGDESEKKKPAAKKAKTAKKAVSEAVSEDGVTDESPVQENGDGDGPEKKKPATKKTKSVKKAALKPEAEPSRKSSRAPKPVMKDGSDDQAYEVEALMDFKVSRGKSLYLVRWKGYTRADDTWEDEASLNCPELLQKYKADHSDTAKKAKKRSASKTPVRTKSKKTKKVEKDYEVEEIVDMRVKKGKKEFRIRWKGYKSSDDSWEPESNLSCQDLIKEYLENHNEIETEAKKTPTKKAKMTMKSARGRKTKTK